MKKGNMASDKIICALITFMIMSFYIFETASWGRYVLFGITILITLVYVANNCFKLPLVINKSFHLHIAIFALFCFASSIWAWNPFQAVSKGMTVFSILVCFSLFYPYFQQKRSIDLLLDAFMFSGYGIALYTVAYYGTSGIAEMLNGNIRLGNDFTNANSIGLITATSCIIQFSYLLRKEKKKYLIFLVPCIIALAISQSRKAMIFLVVGIAFLIMSNGSVRGSILKKAFNIFGGVIAVYLLIYSLSQLEIFSGVFHRFETLFESINGTRVEDIRSVYRRIGMQQFYKTPILGIGIGNSLELLESVGQRRTYLHCNFVELLSSGGIVGFIIYYSIYFKLIVELWKYRKYRFTTTNLCIVLLFLMLIMDYGMVTYYDKQQYLYFMCFFLQLEFIKEDCYTDVDVIEKSERCENNV
ncbi:O-antigen ligase family protein [Streptococcus suis]|uniref:Wzy n=1 Tax=Streptococcus suis TaxID=1307 RepID=A0A1C9IGW8_STRSU|nr:Wzy [Streptococcus suis]HEL1996351.1 O-antigen ligase family protein [Streptococcus suis]HEP1805355.1 O-antigen ligase family protein [Streptococcus suis]